VHIHRSKQGSSRNDGAMLVIPGSKILREELSCLYLVYLFLHLEKMLCMGNVRLLVRCFFFSDLSQRVTRIFSPIHLIGPSLVAWILSAAFAVSSPLLCFDDNSEQASVCDMYDTCLDTPRVCCAHKKSRLFVALAGEIRTWELKFPSPSAFLFLRHPRYRLTPRSVDFIHVFFIFGVPTYVASMIIFLSYILCGLGLVLAVLFRSFSEQH